MMRSACLIVIVMTIGFLLQTSIASDPLFHTCSSSSGNFSDYSPYRAHLDKLLTFLYVKAPPTGFALHTLESVNGLALCRGDVSSDDCKSCIAEANNDLRILCPTHKEAAVWYDFCFLKYSDNDFFGRVDNQTRFELINVNSIEGIDAARFNAKTRELLTRLAGEASRNAILFYAVGEADVVDGYGYGSSNKTTIYGMVECTRDLSAAYCKECLEEAIAVLPSCCGGKQGGRVVSGSCSVHYEIYPFLHPNSSH